MQKVHNMFCQSCAMPMNKPEDFGTNEDDSASNEYCRYCFQKGKFTEQDITMKDMIAKCADIMNKANMPENEINQVILSIPKLNRWSK